MPPRHHSHPQQTQLGERSRRSSRLIAEEYPVGVVHGRLNRVDEVAKTGDHRVERQRLTIQVNQIFDLIDLNSPKPLRYPAC